CSPPSHASGRAGHACADRLRNDSRKFMNDSTMPPTSAPDLASDSPEGSTAPEDPSEPNDEPPSYLLIDHHDALGQRCQKSLVAYEPGDVRCDFAPRRHADSPSRMPVQVAEHHHIELGPTFLELI